MPRDKDPHKIFWQVHPHKVFLEVHPYLTISINVQWDLAPLSVNAPDYLDNLLQFIRFFRLILMRILKLQRKRKRSNLLTRRRRKYFPRFSPFLLLSRTTQRL